MSHSQGGVKSRSFWLACVVIIIAAGIASRVIHTGWVILDKDLGDALYAAMVYALLRAFRRTTPERSAVAALAVMAAVEAFQLTMIPAHLLASEHRAIRLLARLLGTEFAWRDLLAYAAGIAGAFWADRA